MVSKKTTERIIKTWGHYVQDKLDLNGRNITWQIQHSHRSFKDDKDIAGKSYSYKKSARIVIFYNEQRDVHDLKGTIVHELLHCKLDLMYKVIAKEDERQAIKQEEKIVRAIEKLILDLI